MDLKLTKAERMILLLLRHQPTMTLTELQFATGTSSRNYIYRSLQTMVFAGLLTAVDNPERSLILYSLASPNAETLDGMRPTAEQEK